MEQEIVYGEVDNRHSRYYTYALAYPDERVFYVGKGQGDRIDAHESEARQGVQSVKCDIIRKIWAEGKGVVKHKLAFFDRESDALRHETSLISSLGGLSNIASGQKRFYDIPVPLKDKAYFGASVMQFDEDGQEFYSAREVAEYLGYTSWEGFIHLVQQSQKFFDDSLRIHFTPSYKVVHVGRGYKTERELDNYHLSRQAFLFISMRCKLNTPIVEFGKSFIAFCSAADENLCVRGLSGKYTTYEESFGVPYYHPTNSKATMPEDLPTADSIRGELERQRRARRRSCGTKSSKKGKSLFSSGGNTVMDKKSVENVFKAKIPDGGSN